MASNPAAYLCLHEDGTVFDATPTRELAEKTLKSFSPRGSMEPLYRMAPTPARADDVERVAEAIWRARVDFHGDNFESEKLALHEQHPMIRDSTYAEARAALDALSNRDPAGRVRATAAALVKKLNEVHADKRYQGVWQIAQIHGCSYTGPTYIVELEALQSALIHAAASSAPREALLPDVDTNGRCRLCGCNPASCEKPDCPAQPPRGAGREDGWQPIETAPKNTPILTGVVGEKYANICSLLWHQEHCPDGEWAECGMGRTTVTHSTFAAPTHWRPLPPAPQEPQR